VARLNCDVLTASGNDQQVVFVIADPGAPSVRALRRLFWPDDQKTLNPTAMPRNSHRLFESPRHPAREWRLGSPPGPATGDGTRSADGEAAVHHGDSPGIPAQLRVPRSPPPSPGARPAPVPAPAWEREPLLAGQFHDKQRGLDRAGPGCESYPATALNPCTVWNFSPWQNDTVLLPFTTSARPGVDHPEWVARHLAGERDHAGEQRACLAGPADPAPAARYALGSSATYRPRRCRPRSSKCPAPRGTGRPKTSHRSGTAAGGNVHLGQFSTATTLRDTIQRRHHRPASAGSPTLRWLSTPISPRTSCPELPDLDGLLDDPRLTTSRA
jgi:hypothetical protein